MFVTGLTVWDKRKDIENTLRVSLGPRKVSIETKLFSLCEDLELLQCSGKLQDRLPIRFELVR